LFAAFNLLGAIFMVVWLKETRGLSDLAKKQLYVKQNVIEAEEKKQVIEIV
jgi:hypothetical protein